MRAVLQRVRTASVEVDGVRIASVGRGLVVLLGVARSDTDKTADALARKILALRIFDDPEGRMNRSVTEVRGEILCVSNFTLYGETGKGNRPSFGLAASPAEAEPLYDRVRAALDAQGGRFGARMEVTVVNDGPVTVLVEV